MIVCVVLLYTIVDFKNSLELSLNIDGIFVLTMFKNSCFLEWGARSSTNGFYGYYVNFATPLEKNTNVPVIQLDHDLYYGPEKRMKTCALCI
jgi:hypothetical protein